VKGAGRKQVIYGQVPRYSKKYITGMLDFFILCDR